MSYYEPNHVERERQLEIDPDVAAIARTRRAQGLAAQETTRQALEALGGLLPVTPAALREVTVEPVDTPVLQPRILEDSPEFIGQAVTMQDSTPVVDLADRQGLVDQHRATVDAIHDELGKAA